MKLNIKPTNHHTVFIVEDNEMYSLMMDYILSNDSVYHFKSFKTGEECIKNLALNPMMIILDYGLPGINGAETFKEIKKYNPEIPVVILTNNHDLAIAEKLLNEGVYDYLLKEKDSVNQIKKIIDSILNITENKEQNHIRKTTHLIWGSIVFFIVIVLTIIYIIKY